jgi:DNA-binding NtrC family response regulator
MHNLETSNSAPRHNQQQFIVSSDVMRKFMGMVERVAKHVGSVLITGETGTGKERTAQVIHEHSVRSKKPFVEINCAALPEHLVESELFGYEKGAFSGADTTKPGLFELAHSGTIFLDEIGELDLKVQVKLLRVLDRAPYYRLGGHRKVTTDVRVVAATNRNLKEEVKAGRFRKDLYHRLSQFELCVPPLRERPEDIAALAEHFLSQESNGQKFCQESIHALQNYSWPGNVRELQNVVKRLCVACFDQEISVLDVCAELGNADSEEHDPVSSPATPKPLESVEADAIKKALEQTGGHRGMAAEQLGISRRTMSRKLKEYGFGSVRRATRLELGVLDYEQQRLFRAQVKVPVMLQTADGQELSCTTRNLSESGMGLEGLPSNVAPNSAVRTRFLIPGLKNPLDAQARVAWVDAQGGGGVIFTRISPTEQQELNRWLCDKMEEEGWTLQPVPPFSESSVHIQ